MSFFWRDDIEEDLEPHYDEIKRQIGAHIERLVEASPRVAIYIDGFPEMVITLDGYHHEVTSLDLTLD